MKLIEQLLKLYIDSLSVPGQSSRTSEFQNKTEQYSTDFILTDRTACNSCSALLSACNQEILKVRTSTTVDVLPLDKLVKFLPQHAKNGLKNCDYLMCDDADLYATRRIALCDLSCSKEAYVNAGSSTKYPQGKREYVVGQMLDTANFLSKNELLGQHIMTATSRRFIFGVRIKEEKPADIATKSMKAFLQTPSSHALTIASQQKIADIRFNYIEVRYPAALNW